MTDDTLAIASIDEKTLKPPESRVGSASAIRSRITEMIKQDRIRSGNRTVIKKWVNGARPYDEDQLTELAQTDRTNFNPREAEGMIDTAKTPFYTLIFRNSRFLNVRCDYGYQMSRRAEWSEIISESAHAMLDEWEEHDYNVQLYQRDMILFGVGNTVWPDDSNWQWEPVKMEHFLVPDETPANVKKLEEAAIFKSWGPVELWKKIENEKTAKTMGWFPERVKKALVGVAPGGMRERPGFGEQWSEAYESSLRRGDVDWNGATSQVKTWHYLVKEFSGKITECISLEDPSKAVDMNPSDDDSLIFKRVGRYESFEQKTCPFFFDVGEGEWHSVKGLGPKIFDNGMAKARLYCDLIDGARRASLVPLECEDATALQQTQLVTMNGAFAVPPGMKAIGTRLNQDMEGPLRVMHELDNTTAKNVGIYLQHTTNEDAAPTLGQDQLNFRKENQLNEAAFDRNCKTLDRQYYEVMRRAINLGVPLYKRRHPDDGTEKPDTTEVDEAGGKAGAYWFVRRCVEKGVPLEALDMKWICSVKATRGVGSGSPAAMDMSTQGMLGLYPLADERGKRQIVRMRSAFLVGQGNVDAIFPPFEEADVPDDNAWAANTENNEATNPLAQLEITPRQDHVIHFMKHFERASQVVQMAQQQAMNPLMALAILHVLGPHMKDHLNQMVGDPTRKDQLQQLNQAWDSLTKIADQMQQQVDEAMKAQANARPNPQPDPALMAAMAKVQGELKIKAFKAQGDMALKAQKQQQALRLKDLAQAGDQQRANVKTVHEINLSNVQAAAEAAQPEPIAA